jgi:hypothetical protein
MPMGRTLDERSSCVVHPDIPVMNRDLYLTFPLPVEFNGWFITTSDDDPSKVSNCLDADSAGLLLDPALPKSVCTAPVTTLLGRVPPFWRPCRMLWRMSSDACLESGRMRHASMTSSNSRTGWWLAGAGGTIRGAP